MGTDNRDEIIRKIDEDLRGVKKSFEVLLLAIEAEGVTAAAEIAERLMGRLERLMAQIKAAYLDLVFEERVRSLADDHGRLTQMKSAESPSSDEFIELVGRIEKHIATVEREMSILVPRRLPILVWISTRWRHIVLVASAAAALFICATGARAYINRGRGLVGEYYEGNDFTKLLRKHKDLKIDFELDGRGPIRGVRWNNFCVRWTGFLNVPSDGEYEFITRSDDGIRLWINGEQIINNWNIHSPTIDKALKTLKAGKNEIKVEWFQAKGPSMMKLYWRMANDAQPKLIEKEFLSPN